MSLLILSNLGRQVRRNRQTNSYFANMGDEGTLIDQEAIDIRDQLRSNPKVSAFLKLSNQHLKVGMKDPDEVLRKLNVMITGGFDKLLVGV